MRVGWPATRGKRALLISGIGLLALFVAWLTFAWLVIANPKVDHPKHADAIIILGSPDKDGRIQAAQRLIAQHVSDQLVISLNSPKQWHGRELCAHPPAGVTVTCFQPHPSTTGGEAEHMRDLARQHGWHSIVVVTSTYHLSRARTIFGRCLDGPVYMVDAHRQISVFTWAYQYLYQTGGYVKAALQSGC